MDTITIGMAKRMKNRLYIVMPALLILGIVMIFFPIQLIMGALTLIPFGVMIFAFLPYIFIIAAIFMFIQFLGFKKYMNQLLILTDTGFTDNAGKPFRGIEVQWKDVNKYELKKRMGREMILVYLENDPHYYDLVKNERHRKYLDRVRSMYGAIVVLQYTFYDFDKTELLSIFDKQIAQHKPLENEKAPSEDEA